MARKAPDVSVIVPVFNSELYLHEALHSILAQRFGNFEIVVVDDGSETGACEEIVARARLECRQSLRYVRQENRGPAAARNRGLTESAGELIAFLDSDNMYKPDKLTIQVAMMRSLPAEYAFVTGGYEQFVDGTPGDTEVVLPALLDGEIYPALLDPARRMPWTAGAHLFRRVALAEVGGYDCALRYGEDKELVIRLARTFKGKTHRAVVFSRRLHGRSISASIDHTTLLANVSYLVQRLRAADPLLPERVLKRLHGEALLAAARLALRQQGNHSRAVGLMREALRHGGFAASWRSWAVVLSEYAATKVKRLPRSGRDARSLPRDAGAS